MIVFSCLFEIITSEAVHYKHDMIELLSGVKAVKSHQSTESLLCPQ